uniref:Uncharacterized protein n=2 Tax=Tetranychus urticae TaxID=32264 RepID=T1L236_TETUR
MMNKMCEGGMKAITAGTFEKGIKDRNECREKAVSKEVLAAVNKCEELMPMSTADQVKQVCSAKDANVAKLTEKLKCEKAALGDDMPKFGECCKKINPDNA